MTEQPSFQGFTRWATGLLTPTISSPAATPNRIGSQGERLMKHVSLLSASLLLCSAPAFAQAPDTTSRPAQTPDSNSQSDEASRTGQANANTNKTTMTG